MLKPVVIFFIDVMAVHSACFSRMLHSCLLLCTKLHTNKSSELLLTKAHFTFILLIPVSCLWICLYLAQMEMSLDMENWFYNRFN